VELEYQYSVGEWVVHSHYGVGQIKKTEVMPLHGEQTECFKVQVKDGAFWFPTNTVENPRIRPVASQEIISKVIKNLRRKPGNLDKDKKYWAKRIKEATSHDDLLSISQLIRDLSAQQSQKNLSDTQIKILSKYRDNLIHEWAAITDSGIEKIRRQFNEYIQESEEKIIKNTE
jgi:RNA polymerase-interacting CarD/CdnL/TRCF family regulator